jgi:hypothetical protein
MVFAGASAGTLIPSPWSLRAKLLPIHGRSLRILSDSTRPRPMTSPRQTSASARPRRPSPLRRGAPDKRVLSIDLHVLSRSVERIFAPFYSSLDLSQLISHQLDAWHARGARGAGKSVTHRTPAPPRAGDVSTRLSHEKTRYHEAQAPFTRSLNQALLHSRQNRMPPPLAAPSLMPVRKNALALSQLNPSMGISPNRSCLR